MADGDIHAPGEIQAAGEMHTPAAPGGTAALGDRLVARVGYGAMQLDRLRAEPDAALALLRHALDRGVNHLDTAEFYGNGFVNDIVRRAVQARPDVVVVTKVGADPAPGGPVPVRVAQRPEQLRASVHDNLRSLGAERLDVVNLRRMDVPPGVRAEGDQIVPLDDQLAVLLALVDEGKIGAIGLSGVDLAVLRAAAPAGVVCVQNSYSLVSREFEDLLQFCLAQGIAWVPFAPLGGAYASTPKVGDNAVVRRIAAELGVTPTQVGLAWLLAHAPHTLLVPGTADAAHLDANLAAGDLRLAPELLTELDGVTG